MLKFFSAKKYNHFTENKKVIVQNQKMIVQKSTMILHTE